MKEFKRKIGIIDYPFELYGDENVYDLIENSSLVVGFYSTCLIESIALGTPVIQYDRYKEFYGIFGKLDYEVMEYTTTKKQLKNKIEAMLSRLPKIYPVDIYI